MPSVAMRYGGVNDPTSSPCADNYPAGAPRQTCGHVAFVELVRRPCPDSTYAQSKVLNEPDQWDGMVAACYLY